MALSASTIFECQQGATASNVNGGGFNPTNANMLTDLTTDANTGNTSSPNVSSATYTFLATDAGNWLYIKSGTNWTPGWYKIMSVTGGKALLSAAIGSANVRQVVNNIFVAPTAAGCATVGTPTAGTFTIDYSQSTACITSTSVSDYASTGSSTTMTSATAAFTPVMVGNIFHLNNAGTGAFGVVGWYEIVSYTNATTVVTDRTTNSGTAMVAGQGKIGGAISLQAGSTPDSNFFNLAVSSATASTRFFVQGNATYTLAENITVTAGGNASWPVIVEGYNAARGDRPTDSTRPLLNFSTGGTFSTASANNYVFISLSMKGASNPLLTLGGETTILYCKLVNNGTTSGHGAVSGNSATFIVSSELISYRGNAVMGFGSTGYIYGCYIHASDTGIKGTGSGAFIFNNIIADSITNGINLSTAITSTAAIYNNTIYGAENKLGTGLNIITGSFAVHVANNSFYGLATGVSHADVNTAGFDDYNNYFNNTNDVNAAANWQKGLHDIALNPNFVSVSQITGTTGAFTAGNSILVDTTKNFTTLGVVAGRDYLYITGGTGVTNSGMYVGITSISTTTNPNDTLNLDTAQGTNTTIDKTYQITIGQNFQIGQNLQTAGSPAVFPAALTTGYPAIGAVVRHPSTGSFTTTG